jgi:hypothetical protein
MIEVEGPDGVILEFPDGMDPEAMKAAMRKAYPAPTPKEPMGVAKDMALSLPSGVVRGASEIPMLGVTGYRGLQGAREWLGNKLEDAVGWAAGIDPGTPEQRAKFNETMHSGFDRSVAKGQDDLRAKREEYLHTGETLPGKIAGTIGEFAGGGGALPSAATRGAPTMAGRVAGWVQDLFGNAVVPGAMSEAAGQATQGTTLEPWARAAGGIAGGGLTAFGKAYNTTDAITRRAVGGTTEAQWEAARNLRDQSQRTGVNLTGPEMVAQATGGASKAPDLLRAAEGSIDGGAVTGPFFAQRPGQVRGAVGSWLDQISPASPTPSVLGPRASQSAQRVIDGVEQQRTNAVDPLYRMADPQRVHPDVVNGFIQQIDDTIAGDSTGLLHTPMQQLRNSLIETPATPGRPATRTPVTDPKTGAVIRYETTPAVDPTPHVPITDIENLDRARKYFRDQMALQQTGDNALVGERAARVTGVTQPLDQAMEAASPPFAAAKQAYGQMTRDVVEPVAQGPIGTIANAGDTKVAGSALLPAEPLANQAGEVADATRRLVAQDAPNTSALVRENLDRRFTKADTTTAGGQDQTAGGKYFKDLAGNADKRAVLDAVVGELPNGATARATASDLLDVLQATSRRLSPGSPTEPLRQISDAAGQQNLGALVRGALASGGTSLLGNLREFMRQQAIRGTQRELADMFVSPNSLELMQNASNRGMQVNLPEAVARGIPTIAPLFASRPPDRR